MGNILFIEDNPDHQLIVSRMLEKAGHSVRAESTGQSGIDAAKTGGFQLILLDYGLPDMDGMQVLGAIAALGVPVVFVTGRSDQKLAAEALAAGAANYIVKDAHYVSSLPEVVRNTLSGGTPEPVANLKPRRNDDADTSDAYLETFRTAVRGALEPLVATFRGRVKDKAFGDAVGQLEGLLGASEKVLDEELGRLDELLYEELSKSMTPDQAANQAKE